MHILLDVAQRVSFFSTLADGLALGLPLRDSLAFHGDGQFPPSLVVVEAGDASIAAGEPSPLRLACRIQLCTSHLQSLHGELLMHASELANLAAMVAGQGAVLLRTRGELSAAGMQQYWTASKTRLDTWARLLRHGSHADQTLAAGTPTASSMESASMGAIVEEILLSEILTRVWTAVAVAHDRRHQGKVVEPIARSIYIGHLEARNRALHQLVRGRGLKTEEAVALNRLRSRAERWTDLLLAYLRPHADAVELCYDAERTAEFAEDLRTEHETGTATSSWTITLGALQQAFERRISNTAPCKELNSQIGAGILSCFPCDLFDSTGLFKSLWQARLEITARDTEGMLAELLSLEDRSRPKPTAAAISFRDLNPGAPRRF